MTFKSGFISVIGRPNVGKSTLVNRIIGEKIAITSPKPQTTRNRIQAVYTEERGQIIFVDTPGVLKGKNQLDKFMLETWPSFCLMAAVFLARGMNLSSRN